MLGEKLALDICCIPGVLGGQKLDCPVLSMWSDCTWTTGLLGSGIEVRLGPLLLQGFEGPRGSGLIDIEGGGNIAEPFFLLGSHVPNASLLGRIANDHSTGVETGSGRRGCKKNLDDRASGC